MTKYLKIVAVVLFAAAIGIFSTEFFKVKNIEQPENVKTEDPAARIADSSLSLTVDGKILKNAQDTSLPILYLPANVKYDSGQITDENSLFALKVSSLLTRTDFRLSAVRVLVGEVVAYDTQETTVHFDPAKDASIQVDSLQQTVAAAKIDGNKIAKIDLRFDKPVITFK